MEMLYWVDGAKKLCLVVWCYIVVIQVVFSNHGSVPRMSPALWPSFIKDTSEMTYR